MLPAAQMQAYQQQTQTNTMLSQLRQEQQQQIEQAVNGYRQQLVTHGFASDVVQQHVWTYYMQCVQTLFEHQTGTGAAAAGTTPAGETPAPTSIASLASTMPATGAPAAASQHQSMLAQRQQLIAQMTAGGSRFSVGTPKAPPAPSTAVQGIGKGQDGGTVAATGMASGVSALGAFATQPASSLGESGPGGVPQPPPSGLGIFNNMGMAGPKAKGQASPQPPWKAGGQHVMPPGMANGSAGSVRFPLVMRPRPPGMGNPAARMQMQQAQHEQRLMQQQQASGASSSATQQWGLPRAGLQPPGMQQTPLRGKGIAGKGIGVAALGGAAVAGGARPGPQFPPALQKWLQRLFAHQSQSGESDPNLQKLTHTYLRHWVQQWVKSGELWQRNWENAPLPTPDEIRQNLPPGGLARRDSASTGTPAGDAAATSRLGQQSQQGFSGRPGNDRNRGDKVTPTKRDEKRSRSNSPGRRKRSRSRRRRQRSPSSSRSPSRKHSPSSGSDRSASRDTSPRGQAAWWKGKGKGKKSEVEGASRQRVQQLLEEKFKAGDCRGKQKELQSELQRTLNVNARMFRQLFSQTLPQYLAAHYARADDAWSSGKDLNGKGSIQNKATTPVEDEMRNKRAMRFQNHLKAPTVAVVSFNDDNAIAFPGGPIIGTLNEMCSREEAREREQTRQLDKFEWNKGTDARNATVNVALATKKYQRSSADKAYRSQDVRTLEACWKSMEYLMTEILDFDKRPKAAYAVQNVVFVEVYSYLRDRTRACRVDLTLQQPRSTCSKTFVETHEVCLRFEMLSLFLQLGEAAEKGGTEKYDPKLGLKAISQTIEPLLNAYQAVRDKVLAKSILAEVMGDLGGGDDDDQEYTSPWEPSVHRYIILLLMSFSPEELLTHLAKLSKEILSHPLVSWATQVWGAFMTEDYSRFLRYYREADFLTAVAMSGAADIARLRALFVMVRSYPTPLGDKIPLSMLKTLLAFGSNDHAKSFLQFHGCRVAGDFIQLPKKNTPEAQQHPLLTGPNKLPEKCEFPKGKDPLVVAKEELMGLSRADIVFGSADPIVEAAVEVEDADVEVSAGQADIADDADMGDAEAVNGDGTSEPAADSEAAKGPGEVP